MNFKRNRMLFYLQSVDVLGMSIPTIYLIWQRAGLDLADILLLQGIFGLFVLLLEYPSGILADRFGRRNAVAIGKGFTALGLIGYMMGSSLVHFVFIELIFAVGLAAVSGANIAFIWDSAIEAGEEPHAKEIVNTGIMITTGSNMTLLLIGVGLMLINAYLPIYIGIVYLCVLAIVLLMGDEPKKVTLLSAGKILKQSTKYLGQRKFIEVVVISAITMISLRIAFWAYIPKLQDNQVHETWYSVVLMMANMVAFSTAALLRRKKTYSYQSMMIAFAAAAVGIGMFIFRLNVLGVIIAIILHQVARGIIPTLAAVMVNELADSEVRASVQSLKSMVTNLAYFAISSLAFIPLVKPHIMILNFAVVMVLILSALFLRVAESSRKTVNPIPHWKP